MPIYEYVCLDCGEKFETLRAMKDSDAPIACQECASYHTSRTIAVFYAQSSGRVISGGQSSCVNCSSNSCASCRN